MKRMFRSLLLAFLAGFALTDWALGADLRPLAAPVMPVKANPLVYPYQGSGFYWGLNTEAGAAQTQTTNALFVTSLANGHLTAAGGSVGGTAGYLWGLGNSWIAAQATLDWQNITASNPILGSTVSRWNASQVVKIGGLTNILSYLPNLGIPFPVIPPPILPSNIPIVGGTAQPYILAGVQEYGVTATINAAKNRTWGVAPVVGAGAMNMIADSAGKPTGAVLDVGGKVVFSNSSITVDIPTSGGPMVSGATKMGTQYLAYMGIYY